VTRYIASASGQQRALFIRRKRRMEIRFNPKCIFLELEKRSLRLRSLELGAATRRGRSLRREDHSENEYGQPDHYSRDSHAARLSKRLAKLLIQRRVRALMLARFRGHFPLGGEGSTNGQKTPSHLPTGISA